MTEPDSVQEEPMSTVSASVDNNMVDMSMPTLLCISDLEGCLKESSTKVNQSQVLCKKETFDAIDALMAANNNLQVAFLGDYFDVGDMIRESVNGIVGLREKYGERVHIIMGNRDLNKMRVGVEAIEENLQTSVFFIDKQVTITDKTYLAKTKFLLEKTYGAKNLLENIGNNKDEYNGLNVLISIFNKNPNNVQMSEEDNSFIINCRKLFSFAELIKIISVGATNVLVSHGGTYNVETFNRQNISKYNPASYFDDMETIRAGLQFPSSPNMRNSIDCYNQILKSITKTIFDGGSFEIIGDGLFESIKTNSELYNNYLLIQALGLKPNPPSKFLSPIESCSLSPGCQKIIKPDPNFLNFLSDKKNGIKCIAHGHVPFCTSVPLIRKEADIFILSCDTSNGGRPNIITPPDNITQPDIITPITLENVPLGYIQENGLGIASITAAGLSRQNTLGISMDGTNKDFYKNMIRHFNFTDGKVPFVEYNENGVGTRVNYPDGHLDMTQTGMYEPTSFIDSAAPVAKGGTRMNRKHNHRKTKRRTRRKHYCHKCSM